MAFTSTASGVRFSRGRGVAAISIDVSFDRLIRWAKKNKVDTAALHRRSFGRACSGLKKQLVQLMRQGGGIHGVPRFRNYEDFTADYRRVRGLNPSGPIGGVLADKNKIVAFKRGGAQVIGWPDSLGRVAVNFQDGAGGAFAESYFTDRDLRRSFHRRGIRNVPRSYVHNPRPVIEPHWHAHIARNLDDWAEKIFYKDLAKQMAKSGDLTI